MTSPQLKGQCSQRVYLATQLFSSKVGTAMAALLPHKQEQAAAVQTIDRWFDTMNSRRPFDAKEERCGYGITPEHLSRQEAALADMEALVRSMRKASARSPAGGSRLLPFQHGILQGISSVRGLYADLREQVPELRFLMTSHLNQDCVENLFSQVSISWRRAT